jgi:hypothetical protein
VPPKPAESDGALDTGVELRTQRFETKTSRLTSQAVRPWDITDH